MPFENLSYFILVMSRELSTYFNVGITKKKKKKEGKKGFVFTSPSHAMIDVIIYQWKQYFPIDKINNFVPKIVKH